MRNYILFIILSVAGAQAETSRIAALGLIESGNNDAAVGGAGEVSRYQIKPWIWRQYNQSCSYADRRVSTQVAVRHMADLEDRFRRSARREPTDFDRYVLWNAGPTYYAHIAFSSVRVHPVIRERARRYVNLCQREKANAASDASVATASKPDPTVTPAVSPAAELLKLPLPLFDTPQTDSLQNPLFATLPLTARPPVASVSQRSMFAIGGVQPE